VGTTSISVIDADSYWIDGYFEETKMAHVCVGDPAEAALMGYRDPIVERVQTVTRGISVPNAAPSTQGLPSVDPVYTWARLAQRVPVRVRITDVPAGVPLVSDMTATVTIPVPRRGKVVAGFVSVSPALRIAWVTSFTVRSRHPTACRGSATRMARP
jgi:multidrug resistance efflux pump